MRPNESIQNKTPEKISKNYQLHNEDKMPSVSKKQQKFMGIVRSIQKVNNSSKFSKSIQDAKREERVQEEIC